MPNLTLVQLPSNHTYGTNRCFDAKAMVADNDFALVKSSKDYQSRSSGRRWRFS